MVRLRCQETKRKKRKKEKEKKRKKKKKRSDLLQSVRHFQHVCQKYPLAHHVQVVACSLDLVFKLPVTGCCSSLRSLIIGLQAFLLVIILVRADPTGRALRGRATWIASCVPRQRLTTHTFSCGMSSLARLLGAVFAREGTHRGSVWRHSAASRQDLFACSFHRALLVSTAVCGWDVVLLESVPALPCAALAPQPCGYHERCLGPCFLRLSGRRLHGVHVDRAPWLALP